MIGLFVMMRHLGIAAFPRVERLNDGLKDFFLQRSCIIIHLINTQIIRAELLLRPNEETHEGFDVKVRCFLDLITHEITHSEKRNHYRNKSTRSPVTFAWKDKTIKNRGSLCKCSRPEGTTETMYTVRDTPSGMHHHFWVWGGSF